MRVSSPPRKITSPRDNVLRAAFPDLIPGKLHCADVPSDGLLTRFRRSAIKFRHVQLNGLWGFRWMPHDIDRADAYFAHRDANLPPPNFIAINPANGHAHSAILLATPVACHAASRDAPLRFFAAVERGFARRLGADRAYAGHITKNPLHPAWHVEWRRDEPYTLAELADWLFFKDMRPDPSIQTTFGVGRNVTVFDELRQIAYREVLEFKCAGPAEAWFDRCLRVAVGINQQFSQALRYSEVRAIAKSVSKWTWRNVVRPKFSQLQAWRGKRGMAKRWAGHVSERQTKPWEPMGIGRSTYYSRKKAGTLAGWTITTSDKPSPSLASCPLPAASRPIVLTAPHLIRRDGFGLVFNGARIDPRWTRPMRDVAAAVAAGRAPSGVLLPSLRAAA